MKRNVYFMYTGQGSQYFGMGKKYYEEDKVFHNWMEQLDQIVLNEMGHSVLRYLYGEHEASERCDEITLTHVGIFMIEYSMTKSLINKGIIPDIIVGSSLGEYVCMAVSEMLSTKELIRYLIDQSFFLKRKCPEGRMAAVVANYEEVLELRGVDIAAVDYDKHFVISGTRHEILEMSQYYEQLGITVFDLPVQYGFHSRSIDSIEIEYKEILEQVRPLSKAKIPVLSSAKNKFVESYTKEDLWSIIRKPIHFQEVIKTYCSNPSDILVDVGPSSTLAGFCRNILNRQTGIYGIMSQFHTERSNVDRILREIQI